MTLRKINRTRQGIGGEYVFHCPGCGCGHLYEVPRWTFNGNMERPTFTPSLLYESEAGRPRCHLYLTDGQIQYLPDCTHEYAGKTVSISDPLTDV